MKIEIELTAEQVESLKSQLHDPATYSAEALLAMANELNDVVCKDIPFTNDAIMKFVKSIETISERYTPIEFIHALESEMRQGLWDQ